MTINEAYELFMKKQSDKIIGKSKFAELRPTDVLLSSQMLRMKLFLEEMHQKYPQHFPFYGDKFIKACVCDAASKSCMSSNCHLYKDKFHINFSDELYNQGIQNKSAKWYQWEESEDRHTEKVQKE